MTDTVRRMETWLNLPPEQQRVVRIYERIGAEIGERIGPDVLDFGAGAGRHVAEFRAAGYPALGVDQQHESHAEGSAPSGYLYTVTPPDYILPFHDSSFDFVFSTSVMEHVLDPGLALSEVARVLRPDGWSAHIFPSRWRPVEPHIFTPFGGRFMNLRLARLWARLGIRNGFQRDLDPTEVALHNVQYAKTGINYPTSREWELRSGRWFGDVSWSEPAYVEATAAGISRLSGLVRPVIRAPLADRMYRALHTRVLVLRQPLR